MLSEQDVDRELKAALSVSPSPDFEARILQRVEADRPPHWRTHYGWVAAAAALVLAAGVFYAMNRTPAALVPVPAPRIVEHAAPAPVTPPSDVPARMRTSASPR